MGEKKEPGKFTIKFNGMDPVHRQVIDILESMGRTKAQFLANAVLHYIHCDQTPDIPQAPPTDYAMLEIIIRRIIGENLSERGELSAQTTAADTPKKIHRSKNLHFEDAAEILGEDGMAAIASTLSAFHNNT